MDFKTGRDKIDISNLDGIRANFTKIKQVDHFSNQKNEMIVNYNEQDNLTSIMVDCDGNGEAGFKIEVVGVVNHVTDIIMYEGPF